VRSLSSLVFPYDFVLHHVDSVTLDVNPSQCFNVANVPERF